MPQLVPQQPPPPDYYARNVGQLFDDVARRHGDLLDDREWALIQGFWRVGVPARRLFARLVSRSRPWLRLDSLRYREVGDVAAALDELCEAGLAVLRPAAPAEALLGLLTRAELRASFPRVHGRTKADWIASCVARYPDTAIRARLATRHPWVGLADRAAFAACLALFFGGDHRDLSTFVMQDLGMVRYENYPLGPHTRAFVGRDQLARYLLCRRLSSWSKRLDEFPALAAPIRRILQPAPRSRLEQRARDRILNRLGQWHERRGELAEALACYAPSTSHPARERRARLLRRLGDETAVAEVLEEMRADPWAPEEEDFAARFARSPERRLRAALEISECRLRDATPPAIEAHALALLTANGGCGWHLENLLPLGLAGLLFWDVVFAPVPGAFSHPFQTGPRDLFWPDFVRARRARLAARARQLAIPGAVAAELRATCRAKRGVANALVHWSAISDALIDALLANVPHEIIAELATRTLFDLPRARTGFPDLLVIYGRNVWEVVEVKGPNDQLQPAQRVWLTRLRELGVRARVLRFKAAC